MEPVFFPEHNAVLTGPGGVADENIMPLPVLRDGTYCWSLWAPNEEERAALASGGHLLIGVKSGATMPPIAVGVSPAPAAPSPASDPPA